jgi:hypothetical protein
MVRESSADDVDIFSPSRYRQTRHIGYVPSQWPDARPNPSLLKPRHNFVALAHFW